MCYTTTKKLLDKYNCQYVPGERPSNKTQTNNRHIRKLLRRLELLEDLTQEIPFKLTTHQKRQVETLIRKFNNSFKKLHGNASEKTIILAFIFIIKKAEEPKIQISRYKATRKNGLNDNIFSTINCRIIENYMETEPLNPTSTTKYDPNILNRTIPLKHY